MKTIFNFLGLDECDSLFISHPDCQPSNTTLSSLFENAAIYLGVVFLTILIMVGVYKYLLPHKWKDHLWRSMDKGGLAILFVLSWSLGFIVYCVGGYDEGFGGLSVVFMSLIHATGMFVGISDISAVHEAQHRNSFYMFSFGLCHILALFCSLLFIIRQIGFFYISKISAKISSIISKKKDRFFVFWGINDASLLLAEDIVKQSKVKPKNFGTFSIVFVRTHDGSDRESERFYPSNMYDKIKIHGRELARLRKLNCKVISSSQRLSLQTVRENQDILRNMLGLTTLRRIIKNKSTHTHIFMIGEDEESNIKAAINLTFDTMIKSRNVDIYCHCRKSAKTRSLEYYGLTHSAEHTEIHIVDTSFLSISQLKSNVKFHPVNHVTVNKDATIDSPFYSMIVGFGETGQEALRYLYEFGAFVGSDKKKSPFQCHVFDKNMAECRGLFYAQVPFMKNCKEIELHNCSINTSEYWQIIEQDMIQKLNYIIICPGNDNLALETASNLCSIAIRHRTHESPQKLTICIRSYDPANISRLKDFCDDINDKYKVYGIKVEPFGSRETIFTYDCIVNDSLLQQAMEYNYSYENSPEGVDKETVWCNSLGYKDSDVYCIDEIEEIERKREQNFCNALHGDTKLHILDQCCLRRNIPKEIRENLARLEHERWMACMHINGWQRLKEPIDNEDGSKQTRLTTRKLHTDLCPWEEIRKWDKKEQEKTQRYDYKVLDTTLELDLQKDKQ